jgi:NodT family efflux transporter outer membrane factor (OMF) lipoprotein
VTGKGYFKILVATAIVGIAAAGCAVGPDFRPPAPPDTTTYTAKPLPPETAASTVPGGAAQHIVPGGEIPVLWWTLFHSEQLDSVIRLALKDSPTLAAAKATLRQSEENLRALVGSALIPQFDAGASVERQKISGAAFGQPQNEFSPFTLYNASVRVSYALDLFGGARRELESLRSQVDYEQFQLEGAYLSLTANIVTTAVREAVLRAQIRATEEIIAAQQKQLDVVRKQYELGAVARSDLLAQVTQVAQTRATLPPLVKELDQTRHLLAILTGRLPSDAAALPEFELDGLHLPEELPLSLPSALVRQRPDIRAGESLMHAASAQIGVATANLYPQITLSGSYGSQAIKTNELFKSGSTVWGLGAGLLQPLFHGGELTAKRRAAIAAYDQAAAQYRAIVLQAFQNVADVLQALDADADTLKAQAEAEQAAREAFDLTDKQFQLGAVSYLTLLNAERQYQQSKLGLVQAQGVRFADTAALFQALGGGWWNRGKDEKNGAPGMSTGKH